MPSFYTIVLYSHTPILIRRRIVPQGTEGFEDYIPGSTLAAALAKALRLNGGYTLVARGFSVSHAYPVAGEAALPAPTTTLRLKKVNTSENYPRVLTCPGLGPREARRRASEYWERILGHSVRGLVKEVKPGTPLAPTKASEETPEGCYPAQQVRVEASHGHDSVTINTFRGTSESEMLFTYFAIPEGHFFWATVSLPDDANVATKTRLELRIGGAQTRGYGRATAVLLELDTKALGDALNKSCTGGAPLYLWSHALPKSLGEATSHLPPGWSKAKGPKLKLPSYPPGTVVSPEKLLGAGNPYQDPLEARLLGITPPLGHAEPLRPGTLPASHAILNRLVQQAAKILAETEAAALLSHAPP